MVYWIVRWGVFAALWGGAFLVAGSPWCAVLGWLGALYLAYLSEQNFLTYRSAFSTALVGLGMAFSWTGVVFGRFLDLSPIGSWFIGGVLVFYLALQLPIFVFLTTQLRRVSILGHTALVLPLSWLAAEVLFPKPIPWTVGATQLQFSFFTPLAAYGGTPVISFFMLWIAVLLWRLFMSQRRLFSLTIFVVVLVVVSGLVEFERRAVIDAEKESKNIRIAVVQGNSTPLKNYDSESATQYIRNYLRLSQQIDPKAVQLTIWPETSVLTPFWSTVNYIPTDFTLQGERIQTPLIFGGQTYQEGAQPDATGFYNSAVAIDRGGVVVGIYEKRIPFPIAEHLPLENTLREFYRFIGRDPERTKILLGPSRPPQLVIPATPAQQQRELASMAICYESLYSEHFLFPGSETSRFLLELSNLAWFAGTPAIRQHHLLTSWRAVENRRYLLRATNSGLTALVRPDGSSVLQLVQGVEAVGGPFDVPLLSGVTVYASWGGKIMKYLMLAIVLVCIVMRLRKKT